MAKLSATFEEKLVRGRDLLAALVIMAMTSAVAIGLSPLIGGADSSGLIFVLGITLVGAAAGLTPAIICAVLASATFNFYFAEPMQTFRLSSAEDLAPPVVFTLCAIVAGVLSGRFKDQSSRVQATNRRLRGLVEASRELQQASTEADVHAALKSTVPVLLGANFMLFKRFGGAAVPVGTGEAGTDWTEVAKTVLANGVEPVRFGGLTGHLLSGSQGAVGVLVTDESEASSIDRDFMVALARMIGLAFERAQLAARVSEVQALARTEELKSALLSSVSHDIRTPLTAISTSASSLLAFGQKFDLETSRQLLTGIVEECERLNHLTANLLEFTRLQGGAGSLRLSVLPAAEMTRNAVTRQRRFAQNDRIEFKAPRKEIFIEADTALFELALANVIQNALIYSDETTTVIVECFADDAGCRISVTDEGIGIPPAEQIRVFERFHRVERAGAIPKGTGLGLAIAKGFVEASRGSIRLESPISNGRGTRVIIDLPAAREKPL